MNNPTKILSREAIRKAAPSVFATAAHESRSARYGFVPTIDVVNRLLKEDYVCVSAGQSSVRKGREDQYEFTKHLLRFQHRKYAEAERVVGGLIPEVLLINSHNGTSSFTLQAGLFRLVCTNGLVVQDADHGTISVHHTHKIADKVVEAADYIIEEAPNILRVTKEWDAIKLTDRQRTNLANKAIELRYLSRDLSPIDASTALTARRNEDEAPTLWRTFNVLQENLSQGGQDGKTARGRNTRTRSIASVKNNLIFNRGLWQLADAVASRA
jgi:hypothetical protein